MDFKHSIPSRERRVTPISREEITDLNEYYKNLLAELQADNKRLQDENFRLKSILAEHSSQPQAVKLRVGRGNNTPGDYYVSGRVL